MPRNTPKHMEILHEIEALTVKDFGVTDPPPQPLNKRAFARVSILTVQSCPPFRFACKKPSKGQQIGYLRASSLDQNEVREL
jgi:hypothetical protein